MPDQALRRQFAGRFGVPDGGKYSNDWASRIDAVLDELRFAERWPLWICPHGHEWRSEDPKRCPVCNTSTFAEHVITVGRQDHGQI